MDGNKNTNREGRGDLARQNLKIAGHYAGGQRVASIRLDGDETKWKGGKGKTDAIKSGASPKKLGPHVTAAKIHRVQTRAKGDQQQIKQRSHAPINTNDNIDGHKNGYCKDTKQPPPYRNSD
jgi:hypothetical protein